MLTEHVALCFFIYRHTNVFKNQRPLESVQERNQQENNDYLAVSSDRVLTMWINLHVCSMMIV